MKTTLVVTTIHPPTEAMKQLAKGAAANDWNFVVVCDLKTPANFELKDANVFGYDRQCSLDLESIHTCPTNHYARKNIGYLIAMLQQADVIVETDDDNFPYYSFFKTRPLSCDHVAQETEFRWFNVYSSFQDYGDLEVWPRGFPLEFLHRQDYRPAKVGRARTCPIVQDLADLDPDVDAVFRLTRRGTIRFKTRDSLALAPFVWSPFNSQATHWNRIAFELMYLPSTCSFRATDIYRSYVAQRVAWTCGWSIMFRSPTVYQLRNEHNLLDDFSSEVDMYKNADRIARLLAGLELEDGFANIRVNQRRCYEALVERGILDSLELERLSAWEKDITRVANLYGENAVLDQHE